MELIQFNKNGGPVTIDIVIDGLKVWSYVYSGDFTFKNNSVSGRERNHTLGLPVNLDNDINAWDIRFGNISENSIAAIATINWMQDGQVLNTWTRQVQVLGESATKISDDALLIGTILTAVI
jgi:hypothetical protein